MNKYVERLFNEWKQYGKIIIAIDFDDTISPWKMTTEEDKKKYEKILKLLKDCKYTGAYLSIWSACTPDRYQSITDYCNQYGIVPDSINRNPIELPYGNHVKMYANIFLDDRAGLDEAIDTLTQALYKYRGYLQEQKVSEQNN